MSTTLNMLERAQQLQNDIVTMRRHLHEHPELSFLEVETSKLAAGELGKLGYKVRTGVARTGVVADKGDSGRMVAIRADMDGLPIQETTGKPYQSKNDNVMHACGHDAHVSCAIATARLLADEKLPGRLRFL